MIRILTAAGIALCIVGCAAQPPAGDPSPLNSLSGMQLYEQLCSSCHGAQAQGDGAVAPLIKTGVPDLTQLAARNGGDFPKDKVRKTIDGRFDRPAHGPRDMPVWGWQLYEASSSNDSEARAGADAMIGRLVDYLQTIQRS